jgi:NAD(P)-dependent dehydrogenase (short-subunit alcohol dehydrogenase family)
MADEFTGKSVLVTGAASGIGRAIAGKFAARGARLLLVDIDAAKGKASTDELSDQGAEAHFFEADVADASACARMVDMARNLFGRLDAAVNNAGIADGAVVEATENYPTERWDRIIAVNLSGVFHCLRSELPLMLQTGGGAIVNTASISGLVTFPGTPAYVAAKHGVIGLTKMICNEFAARGIRCNAVAPGIIDTPLTADTLAIPAWETSLKAMIPTGRIGRPQDVADVVLWLCSDAAAYVNGHVVAVDGGILVR